MHPVFTNGVTGLANMVRRADQIFEGVFEVLCEIHPITEVNIQTLQNVWQVFQKRGQIYFSGARALLK